MASPTFPSLSNRQTDLALAASVVLYTLVMAMDSLSTGLGHDDLMNLTNAWRPGIEKLLFDNLRFYEVGSAHRPFGEVLYWILFRWFGFDPFPYRVVCLGLLAANSALLYWVCRSLELSRSASWVACMLHGYHYGFWALYYNTGTCYDLLAFFFYFLAIGSYIHTRRLDRPSSLAVFADHSRAQLERDGRDAAGDPARL